MKDYYKFYKDLIESKGGIILSKEYINNTKQIKFKCDKGHFGSKLPHKLKLASWCTICSKQLTITNNRLNMYNKLRDIIEKKGGIMISTKHKHSTTRLKFYCKKKHIVYKQAHQIIDNGWCKICNEDDNKNKILNSLKQIAKERGGECLSTEYINDNTKLLLKCSNNHQWEASHYSIKYSKSWCPSCNIFYIREEICRQIFEIMFNKKFLKIRPDWLLSFKNNPLELDGYNEELNIAFEHNGKQHYEDVRIFGCSKTLRLNDKLKIKQCNKKGVRLIIIPYTCLKNDIQQFIITECKKFNIDIPNKTNINLLDINIKRSSNLDELKTIAEEKGGTILSTTYLGSKYKLEFKCNRNHTWFAAPSKIKLGRWCPECRYIKDHYEFYKDLIENKGGTIISKEYINSKTKLDFYCDKGHKIATTSDTLKAGHWCKQCSLDNRKINGIGNKTKAFNEIKKVVENKGGTMISTKYGLSGDKLQYYCDKNHLTSSNLKTLKIGRWCTICNNLRLKDADGKLQKFNEVKDMVEKKGGRMISTEYVDAKTPLKFYCEKNHVSSKIRNQLRSNLWCKTCNDEKSNHTNYILCKKIIEDKKGTIISKEYISHNKHLEFYCKNKHKISMIPRLIKRTRLEFYCENNHLNKKLTCDLKAGSWCAQC